ncbi:MAG: hypothetical protein IJJ00_07830 [Erysipelotrichaceae bacterium]|nr:hypothetical protein [Erysipelotrichaceae bacterium]
MKTLINDELEIVYPEGFHEMNETEKKEHNITDKNGSFCLSDEERHIIITVFWKNAGGLISALVKPHDAVVNMEKAVSGQMQKFGYKFDEFIVREAGDKTADGYRYDYKVDGLEMSGESFIVKNSRTFYYIHSYYRTALKEESLKVLDEIFGSLIWK